MSMLPTLNASDMQTLGGMRLLAEACSWNVGKANRVKETAAFLRQALRLRTGINWSISSARGTAYGWLRVRARGARAADAYGRLTESDRDLLREALGFSVQDSQVGFDGVSIPSGRDYYKEYVQRALGVRVTTIGKPYWD